MSDSILPLQQSHNYQGQISLTLVLRLSYLVYLPPEYEADPLRQWPVVFFLHGSGERGDNLELLKVYGLPKLVEQGQSFPFIIVSPQCPASDRWPEHLYALDGLYTEIMANYRIDPAQVYLTGLSMGGNGAWRWAIEQPNRFAALAPICGWSYPERATRIKHLPTWVFHGAKDEVVPISTSEEMVKALRDCGADVRFTVYPEAAHDSWTETYANPELYEWLLSYQL